MLKDLQEMLGGRVRSWSSPTMHQFIPQRVNLVVSERLIVAEWGVVSGW